MARIEYSDKYFDDTYEYRHVVLPPEVAKLLPKNRILAESEWRAIGVQQSRGWVHYAIHRPEPHIMLFRRTLNYQAPNPIPKHVVLPPEVAKLLPKNRILAEFLDFESFKKSSVVFWFLWQSEWRAIGVQQSRGWVHYAIHRPEPHIMLFRRTLNYQAPNPIP
ncbi:hypothetical protein F2Q69_00016809, partial [Brassica cretica]